jgi:Sec-independent protein translocase protein TatA
MQIGWGQLLFIAFLIFLLFGNLPKLIKDITDGIQKIKKENNSINPSLHSKDKDMSKIKDK